MVHICANIIFFSVNMLPFPLNIVLGSIPKTPNVIPPPWYSQPCGIPSPWVWARLSNLILTNRVQQNDEMPFPWLDYQRVWPSLHLFSFSCTILHSHQWCMRVLLSPHPCQHLKLPEFKIIVIVILMCI